MIKIGIEKEGHSLDLPGFIPFEGKPGSSIVPAGHPGIRPDIWPGKSIENILNGKGIKGWCNSESSLFSKDLTDLLSSMVPGKVIE